MYRQSEKKLVKQQYVLTIWWISAHQRLRSIGEFGAPRKFQRVSRLGFVTAAMALNGGQPNFPRCLAVSLACTLYVHFGGSYCTALEQWTSAKLRRSPIFGRAAIRLGIGRHSRFTFLLPFIIRLHRRTTYVGVAYYYRPSIVVCRSVTLVSPAKTAEPIEMPFGLWTRVRPRKHY